MTSAGARAKWPWLLGGLLSVALAVVALRRDPGSAPHVVAASPSANIANVAPVQRQALEPFARQLEQAAPPSEPERVPGKSNAEAITQLADTSEDPRVVIAALREVLTAFAARGTRKPAPDAELERVLAKRLRSSNGQIAAAALQATRVSLMRPEPSEALSRAVADESAPERDAPRRYAALEALNLLRPDRRAGTALDAFERALSAHEPFLVSLALLCLSQSGASLASWPDERRRALGQRALELAEHADPGVRGHALLLLAELEGLVDDAARLGAALKHLTDAHPYVRAQAADTAWRCREPLAIHALIDDVADTAAARYELVGFNQLDASVGSLLHVVPGRSSVGEAALLGMLSLSQDLPGVTPLELTLNGRAASPALILENAGIARAWYRSFGPRIPREPRN
ncbi:MAG: hypothetical protein QM756_38825 [Polyangiaceae bacterium]